MSITIFPHRKLSNSEGKWYGIICDNVKINTEGYFRDNLSDSPEKLAQHLLDVIQFYRNSEVSSELSEIVNEGPIKIGKVEHRVNPTEDIRYREIYKPLTEKEMKRFEKEFLTYKPSTNKVLRASTR